MYFFFIFFFFFFFGGGGVTTKLGYFLGLVLCFRVVVQNGNMFGDYPKISNIFGICLICVACLL